MTKKLTLCLVFLTLKKFKTVYSGFVVGEDGQGHYTKGSENMMSNRNAQIGKNTEDLPELPALPSFDDFQPVIETYSEPTESSIKAITDPNHQKLIKPDFQLVKEWDCSIPGGECRNQMDKFLIEMNKRRAIQSAFNYCKEDFFITKYGKALRFSLRGTVNTFNAWVENNCGECLRCNYFGWFDEFGFLKNFDYDCIKNTAILEERAIAKKQAEETKIENEKMKKQQVTDLKNLIFEAKESGIARLEGRRRAL